MIKRSLIKKIVSTEVLQCPYSVETRHPFLYYDPETEKYQIFLYGSEKVNEAMIGDMFPLVQDGYMIEWKQIKKNGLRIFLINCRILGVDELKFQDGSKTEVCSLDEFLDFPKLVEVSGWNPIPKWNEVPVERRPVMNPDMHSLLLNYVQKMRRKVCGEEIVQGLKPLKTQMTEKLITCNVIVPFTLKSGKSPEDDRITDRDIAGVTVVTDQEGNEWVPVFTDQMEYTPFANNFFKNGKILPTLNTIPGLASGLPKSCKGIIVNPDTASFALNQGYLSELVNLAAKTAE